MGEDSSREDEGVEEQDNIQESLKTYVCMCFKQCVTELDKDLVEAHIREKIDVSARNN